MKKTGQEKLAWIVPATDWWVVNVAATLVSGWWLTMLVFWVIDAIAAEAGR
jgi:hypothetical protein